MKQCKCCGEKLRRALDTACGCGQFAFYTGLGECFSEKVLFEQNPEEGEEVSMRHLEESRTGRG